MSAEKAWSIPYGFKTRLGSFEFRHLQKLSVDEVKRLMSKPTPLHRWPQRMAKNFHSAIQLIAEKYSGNASSIWRDYPASATLVRRFLEFDGIGVKIANMAANILVREMKIPVRDETSIDVSPDVQVLRVFKRLGLLRTEAKKEELIYRARELNPRYPGVFDRPAWKIGRSWCRPQNPRCGECYMSDCCPTHTRSQTK